MVIRKKETDMLRNLTAIMKSQVKTSLLGIQLVIDMMAGYHVCIS